MEEDNTPKQILELFSANCKLCEVTINVLKETVKKISQLKLVIHKASECIDGSCCELAAKYGVYAVPSLVIDGKLVHVGKLSNEEEIRKYIFN